MKNITKALVAYGLLLSISGCNQQVMDCLSASSTHNSHLAKGIDGGGSPTKTLGINNSPSTPVRGIDGGGSPILGIDGGGSPVSTSRIISHSNTVSLAECLQRANLVTIRGIDGGGF